MSDAFCKVEILLNKLGIAFEKDSMVTDKVVRFSLLNYGNISNVTVCLFKYSGPLYIIWKTVDRVYTKRYCTNLGELEFVLKGERK